MATASECVREIFPGSSILPNRTAIDPANVKIVAEINGEEVEVWSGSQISLFSKYQRRRAKSMAKIKEKLRLFRRAGMAA